MRPERHTQGVVRPYLDGLLPEGESRLAIAQDFNLRASDTFGLVHAIGRDCAGAVVIQPVHDAAPPPPSTLGAEALTDDEIGQLIANLRTAPLGVDARPPVTRWSPGKAPPHAPSGWDLGPTSGRDSNDTHP